MPESAPRSSAPAALPNALTAESPHGCPVNGGSEPWNLVLTGGGTAGHVWPHFAIADDASNELGQLVANGRVKVHYVGSHEGMERDIVQESAPGWHYVGVATGKLRRYFSWKNFTDALRVFKGFFDAFFVLGKVQADVVFSKGGFVSAPVVWAAWLRGVPVVIHESDATPALATKLTLPFAHRALVSFPQTLQWISPLFRSRTLAVGLPMRNRLFCADKKTAMLRFELSNERKTLLVFGGSLGAEALNRLVATALPALCEIYNVIHVVGKGKSFETKGLSFYRQFEFLRDDMALAYACADLALCRAGASSIFECAALRLPMILVPLGLNQSRGDQIVNARLFEASGWAQWVKEEELDGNRIVALVNEAMSDLPARKSRLESAPAADAAGEVAKLLVSLMARRKAL
ncbi:MAG: UDP-N-acetylglucosamine--N-acetylmuramyl-(pentapeptide) pyrophosphoryl-undecaprenol N-acetylglucosamine transferase [Silvanigrellales bacterium]|nr:UDP-N-acetylglucosamine--N-acetylmuramyl-(pentapeptide) pyrophosphoryl-undecaprenol N-acetylglucosamine transferase [Silvanigrellales bacterium]